MCHSSNRNSLQCIVPPHMLDVMEMRGDSAIRKMVKSMRGDDESIRKARLRHMGQQLVEKSSPGKAEPLAFMTPEPSVSGTSKPLDRVVYDGERKAGLPGSVVRAEGSPPSGDDAVDEAYDGAGVVHELFKTEYGRNSLDGEGMQLRSTVHHRRKYNNAFWNGEQMVYGDGDGQIFQTMTELSIIGHEMTHGVVQFSGGLIYEGQSGALNESIADCFGSLTIQKNAGLAACEASWLIGEGILGPDISGVALRSMKAPGTAYNDSLLGQDPQPYHMDFYVNTTQDHGGVHINSGIPNQAFYLFSQYMGGNAWEKPGTIWYRALQTLNNPNANFNQWAEKTMHAAMELHGIGSWEAGMLKRSWKLVGIDV